MNRLVLLTPVLLLVPLSGALAQAGGSYRGSCSNINQDGSMLTAECRGPGGQRFTTSIDTSRCGRGGIANSNGRLTCGGVQGSAMPSRGGGQDFGYGGQGDDGYQGRPRPRPRYAPPPQDFGYDAPPPRRPHPYYGDDQGPPPRYDDQDD